MTDAAIAPADAPTGELVLPPGWRVDAASRARLERLLASAPAHIVGVVAPRRELLAGATFRSQSERLSLLPRSDIAERAAGVIDGAVLLRPGVGATPTPDGVPGGAPGDVPGGVEVDRGLLLVDRGTLAHDPGAAAGGALAGAHPLARSPFPWRPVVVFLAGESVPAPDAIRRLINDLVDAEVEACLAAPSALVGPWLAQPCVAERRSIEALRPDIVITLDDAARASVDDWCAGDRGTVVVDLVEGATETIELVPWTLGRAQGRVRARVTPDVDAAALAQLVSRLSAGPHPVAPQIPDARATTVAVRVSRSGGERRPATLRSIRLVHGALDAAAAARVETIGRLLDRRGHQVVIERSEATPVDTRSTDLVILHAVPSSPGLEALLTARRTAGRASVIDIAPRDLTLDAPGEGWAELTDEGAALVALAGAAVTPSTTVRRILTGRGVRCHRLPTPYVLTPSDEAAVAPRAAGAIIGWDLGSALPPTGGLDVVGDALISVLDEHPGLALDVVGDATAVPARLAGRAGVHAVVQPLRAYWLFQVWSPWLPYAEAADAIAPILEAGRTGLATVVAAQNPAVARGLVEPEATVIDADDRDAWVEALRRLLDEPDERVGLARRAASRTKATFSPVAAVAAVDEVLAWAGPPEGST